MPKKIAKCFVFFLLMCASSVLIMLTTSCCTRNPDKIPPSDSVRLLGSHNSRWLLGQISPISGIENHGLKLFVVCRFYGETKWVIKLNGGYCQYRCRWGHYVKSDISQEKVVFSYNSKVEPVGLCKVKGINLHFLDVDALKELLPKTDLVVVDDGKVGFLVTPPNSKEWTIWEYTTLRFGGGFLIKEADTVSLLLKELNKMK